MSMLMSMSRTLLLRRLLCPSSSLSPSIVFSSKSHLSSPSFSSSFSSSRFSFSSHTHNHNPTNINIAKPSSQETPTPPSSSSSNHSDDIPSDVTTEELRQRIGKYLDEGDEEAIPSIFEAILARKLSGKHEDSDEELMEKFGLKMQHDDNGLIDSDDDDDDDLSDSDEDMSDSDEEDSD